MPFFLLLLNVIIMTMGQLSFKHSAEYMKANPNLAFPMNYLTNQWFFVAVTLFGISTIIWTQVLTKLPLSVAYPVVSFAYVFTVFGAFFIFHEKITQLGVLGVFLIVAGITLTVVQH